MQNALRLLVHRLPRAEQRDRREEPGQHEQQQADAVDADGVADAERRNPGVALDELEVGRRGVEPRPQQQRLREHHAATRPAPPACMSAVAPARRGRGRTAAATRADDRQRDEGREDRERSYALRARTSRITTGSSRGSAPRRGTATRRRRGPSRSAAGAAPSSPAPTTVARRR